MMFKNFVRYVAYLGFIATANVCAQQELGSLTLTISAELLTPNCDLEFPSGDSVDLGLLTSNHIANAPSAIDATALTYIRAKSAYGDLESPYQAGRAPIILRISCKDKVGNTIMPPFSKYSLTFGDIAQTLSGTLPGSASAGYGFKLTTGGTAVSRNLGFFAHIKDVRGSASGGKNGLVRPGEKVALIDGLSFYQAASSDAFVADFEVSPGVFWVNSDKSAEGGKFSTELIVTLKFN